MRAGPASAKRGPSRRVDATGHEIGGTLGIAVYAGIATAASGGIFVGPAAAAGHMRS